MKFWNTFFSKRKVRKNINEDKKNLSPQIETEKINLKNRVQI